MTTFIHSKVQKWLFTHFHAIAKLLSGVLLFTIALLLHFLARKTRVFNKKETRNLMEQIPLDYLPPELLTNILIRLPLKTLLQYTSVSKSWYTLITSPYFITTHLNIRTNSINRNQTRLVVVRHCTAVNKYSAKDSSKEQYTLHWDNDSFDEFAKLDFPLISTTRNKNFRIVGICKGLVCLSGDMKFEMGIMALWNPSLRKSLILPKPNILRKSTGFIQIRIRPSIGFGIDPITNDYKIVRLNYVSSFKGPEVELFELSTGSWRNINADDFSYVVLDGAEQAFLNGVVHWAGYNPKYNSDEDGSSFHSLIVSFDMRNDALGILMAPACVQQHWDRSMRVTIFRDLLSFSHFDVDDCWCIWVMNEYGIEGSWTMQFKIDLGGDFWRPVCFKETGDILLETCPRYHHRIYHGVELGSYDPKSKLIKNLDIHGMAWSFYVDTYNESLVLTKGLNEVLGRQQNSGAAVTCQGTSVMPREDNEVELRRSNNNEGRMSICEATEIESSRQFSF